MSQPPTVGFSPKYDILWPNFGWDSGVFDLCLLYDFTKNSKENNAAETRNRTFTIV